MKCHVQLKNKALTKELLKELVFMFWFAAGYTDGMGFMKDNPQAQKDDVFDQAVDSRDYATSNNKPGEIYMDYVFGRCLKTRIKHNDVEGAIEISPNEPERSYQCWDRSFKTAQDLVQAVLKKTGIEAVSVLV